MNSFVFLISYFSLLQLDRFTAIHAAVCSRSYLTLEALIDPTSYIQRTSNDSLFDSTFSPAEPFSHQINIADSAGLTPLHHAALEALPEMMSLLQKKGANTFLLCHVRFHFESINTV